MRAAGLRKSHCGFGLVLQLLYFHFSPLPGKEGRGGEDPPRGEILRRSSRKSDG